MRIKHWQGYGSVDAKRTGFTMNQDGTNTVQITVKGMHEYGLTRYDNYDVYNWLMKRFAKDCADYRDITGLLIHEPDGGSAVYTITYKPYKNPHD